MIVVPRLRAKSVHTRNLSRTYRSSISSGIRAFRQSRPQGAPVSILAGINALCPESDLNSGDSSLTDQILADDKVRKPVDHPCNDTSCVCKTSAEFLMRAYGL